MNTLKLAVILGVCFVSSLHADVISYFNSIKNDPSQLELFFKEMPKGGELHYHLAGGPPPETMLALAAKGDFCLNTKTFVASQGSLCKHDTVKISDVLNNPVLYSATIKNWSLQDFTPGPESAHDHFLMALVNTCLSSLLIDLN